LEEEASVLNGSSTAVDPFALLKSAWKDASLLVCWLLPPNEAHASVFAGVEFMVVVGVGSDVKSSKSIVGGADDGGADLATDEFFFFLVEVAVMVFCGGIATLVGFNDTVRFCACCEEEASLLLLFSLLSNQAWSMYFRLIQIFNNCKSRLS